MDRIVADASVVVKFFVNEENSENARRLMDALISKEVLFLEPPLLEYEVLNAMLNSKNRYEMSQINDVVKALANYNFTVSDINEALFVEAIKMSIEYRISIYDAVYVALASITNSRLYTADKGLIDAVKLPFVKHIREF